MDNPDEGVDLVIDFNLDKIENPIEKYGKTVLMIRKPTEDVLFHIQSTLQYTEVKEPKQIHEQDDQFKLALLEYERGFNNSVQEMCEQLLTLQPDDVNILLLLSAAYYKLGQYDKSIESLNNVPLEYRKSVEVLNNLGSNYYLKGQMIEARDYYYDAICREPGYVNCWMNYIKVLVKTDDQTNALKLLQLIIEFKEPDFIKARNLYGTLLLTLNKVDDALNQFKLSIKSNPRSPISWIYLGNLYYSNTNDIMKAMKCYEKAIEIDDSLILPKINLGLVYLHLKDFFKSVTILLAAYRLSSCDESIIRMVGLVYWSQKNISMAIQAYQIYLAHDSNNVDANFDLGVLYHAWQNRSAESEPYFTKCIELDSQNEIYYKYLAMAYQNQKKYSSAAKACEVLGDLYCKRNDILSARTAYYYFALLAPQNFRGHWKLGLVFYRLGHFSHAYLSFKEAVELKTIFSGGISKCDSTILLSLVQCQQNICLFTQLGMNYQKFLKQVIKQQLVESDASIISPLQSLLYHFSPIHLKHIAIKYALEEMKRTDETKAYDYNEELTSDGRIRVGYIFSNTGNYSTGALVKAIRHVHDMKKLEVFCYSLTPIEADITKPTDSSVSDYGIIDISILSSTDAADKINADKLNILVGVNGFPRDDQNKILALRPAPIQVKLLGFPGTTGTKFIDYIVTDKTCSPPEAQIFYTEKFAYLNRTVFFGSHKMLYNDLSPQNSVNMSSAALECEAASVGAAKCDVDGEPNIAAPLCDIETQPYYTQKYWTRQMLQLPEDSIVYCYYGELVKVDEITLIMWVTILKAVPNSVLWLLRLPGDAEYNIHEFIKGHDLETTRVIFSDYDDKEGHIRRIHLADIFLDTPLYNGHLCCMDTLWAGIPIVTILGKTFATRMTASQLTAMNGAQTIARDESDYIRKAIDLGMNKSLLEEAKSNIWQSKNTSALYDFNSYAEELESAYTYIWSDFIKDK